MPALDWEASNFFPGASADKVFMTYWTNAYYDYSYIEDQAYSDAWQNYIDQFGTTAYWLQFGIETGISLGISDSNPISSAFVLTVFILAAAGLTDAGTGLMCASIASALAGSM